MCGVFNGAVKTKAKLMHAGRIASITLAGDYNSVQLVCQNDHLDNHLFIVLFCKITIKLFLTVECVSFVCIALLIKQHCQK